MVLTLNEIAMRDTALERLATAHRTTVSLADVDDDSFRWYNPWRGRYQERELTILSWWKTPVDRIKFLESVEPYSAHLRQTWFYTFLSWFVIFLFTFVCRPFLEEAGKRVVTYLIHDHSVGLVTFVLSLLTKHLLHVDSDFGFLTAFLSFFSHTFAPALAGAVIGLVESRNRQGPWWFLEFFLRSCAHFLLTLLPFMEAVVIHLLFNLFVSWYDSRFRLQVQPHDSRLFGGVHDDICTHDFGVAIKPIRAGSRVNWGIDSCVPRFGVRQHWTVGCQGYSRVAGTIFRQCSHNERAAVCGRVLQELPVHRDIGGRALRTWFWARLTDAALPLFQRFVKPVTVVPPWKYWVRRFPPGKAKMLTGLYESGADLTSKTASCFIKREVAMKVDPSSWDDFKDPRWIQGLPPILTVKTGRAVQRAAKNFREGFRPGKSEDREGEFDIGDIRQGRQILYCSGLTANQIGESYAKALRTVQSACPIGDSVVVVESDQSRFDLHLGPDAFRFGEQVYKGLFTKDIQKYLQRTVCTGRSHLGTTFAVEPQMQSGSSDTAFFDRCANAGMYIYIHVSGRIWIVLLIGDDTLLITLQSEIDRLGGIEGLILAYRNLGMEVEVKLHTDPLRAEFCSGRMYPVGESFVLMPKIGKIIAKLACDQVDRSPSNQIAWLRGISETLLTFGKVDPLLLALGQAIYRFTGGGRKIASYENEYRAPVVGELTVSSADVSLYYETHYGMSWSAVTEIQALLSGRFFVGKHFESAWLEEMVRVDLL